MVKEILDVSVVICAYASERWDNLLAAVESLRQQVSLPREIIVVIDHNPQLLDLACTQLSNCIVTENRGQRGLSDARNSGIVFATGTYVAFLDDDAVAEPEWLLILCRLCANPRILGAGGSVEPAWIGERPAWFPEEFYWVVGCSYRGLPRSLAVVRNPYGGCTCMRREIFEAVGGFRSGLGRIGTHPLGGEETELSIRAKLQWPQYVFLYEPAAKIHHQVTSSRMTWRYFLQRCYAEGLSKAAVSYYVGMRRGLASERGYTLRILPLGVLRGLGDALMRRDLSGLCRAGAILMGLCMTMSGYVAGIAALRNASVPEMQGDRIEPVKAMPEPLAEQNQVIASNAIVPDTERSTGVTK